MGQNYAALFLVTLFIMFAPTTHARQTYFVPYTYLFASSEQSTFIQNHLLHDSVEKQMLDEHFLCNKVVCAQTLAACPSFRPLHSGGVHIVGLFTELNGLVIKMIRRKKGRASIGRIYDDVDSTMQRIIESERMRQHIDTAQCQHIIVPRKYLYHIPGMPTYYHDDNFIVVVKYFDIVPKEKNLEILKSLSYETDQILLEELFYFIARTGYEDARSANICCIDEQRKLFVILDTEAIALQEKKRFYQHGLIDRLHQEAALRGLHKFCKCLGDVAKEEWMQRVTEWKKQHATHVEN